MNEQLQEFYRQSIESTNTDECLDMPNKQVQRLILAKYAELIVKECARLIDCGDGEGCSMAETAWCNICRDEILEHFGVK